MSWEPESGSSPATTPAASPPAFDALVHAAQLEAQGDAREREQLENKIDAVEDLTRKEIAGWFQDLAPWVGGGLVVGVVVGYFTRRKS